MENIAYEMIWRQFLHPNSSNIKTKPLILFPFIFGITHARYRVGGYNNKRFKMSENIIQVILMSSGAGLVTFADHPFTEKLFTTISSFL